MPAAAADHSTAVKPASEEPVYSTSLLRREAIDAATSNAFGRPVAALPVSWSVIAVVLSTMGAASFVLLIAGTYTRKEVATGVVRAVNGEIRVTASTPGVVRSVRVREGDAVRVGQTLLIVDTLRKDVTGGPSDQEADRGLTRELESLSDRREALTHAAKIDQASFADRERALRREQSALQGQEEASRQRLALARDAIERLKPVAAKGYISGDAMRRRQEEVIVLTQAIEESRGSQARLDAEITQLSTAQAQRPIDLIKEQGQIDDLISRARREKTDLIQQRGYSIVATTNGVVTALQITPGRLLEPQQSLMSISPVKPSVIAEVFVPSRAIGFLQPGQEVKLRYDAFPYQRFGVASANVTSISSSVLRPQDIDAPVRIEEPVYRVLVTLKQPFINAYGKRYSIRPGIGVTADIILEKRSFGRWLLDPVLALRGRL